MNHTDPLLETTTGANGFGLATVTVRFSHALSESDPQKEFNLDHQMPEILHAAHRAMVLFLAEREARNGESLNNTATRLAPITRMLLDHVGLDAQNLIHSMRFIELDAAQSADPLTGLNPAVWLHMDHDQSQIALDHLIAELPELTVEPAFFDDELRETVNQVFSDHNAHLNFDDLTEDEQNRITDAARP